MIALRFSAAWAMGLLGVGACGSEPASTNRAPAGAVTSGPVQTSKGTFTLPSPALADGRELEGRKVRVWNSLERTGANCEVPDGEPLVLEQARRHEGEGRYYFQLTAMNGCKGWLPETFVRPDPDVRR
jgi:hypothetical protein